MADTKIDLLFIWNLREEFYMEYTRLSDESKGVRRVSDELWQNGHNLHENPEDYHMEGEHLCLQGHMLKAEADILSSKADELASRAEWFRSKGDIIWLKALTEAYGNIKMQWNMGTCEVKDRDAFALKMGS